MYESDPETTPVTGEYDDDATLWHFQFGAYGETKLYVWVASYDDIETAFEYAVEWLDDNAPGHLVSFDVQDYRDAAEDMGVEWRAEWPDDSEEWYRVVEAAEADHTVIGHTTLKNGTHVASWEWACNEVEHGSEEWRGVADRSAPAYGPTFDRFDICEAYYLFGSQWHGGMGSPEYALLSRVGRIMTQVRHDLCSRVDLTENGRAIYDGLVERFGHNKTVEIFEEE